MKLTVSLLAPSILLPALSVGGASSLAGQAADSAIAFAGGGALRVTSIHGDVGLLAGGWVGIAPKGDWTIGGGGYSLARPVDVPTLRPGMSHELRLGYAGIVGEYSFALNRSIDGNAGALFGAGNARLKDPVTGVEVGSDNFFLLDAGVTFTRPVKWKLQAGVGIGYRYALGVEDLLGVEPSDLRGVTFTLSLRWRDPTIR